MKNTIGLLVLLIAISCETKSQDIAVDKIDGLSLTASKEKIKASEVEVIKQINATYVALMPFGFIRDLNHPTIEYNNNQWFGETKEGITQYTQELQNKDLKIMLKPQIWVWGGHYTGKIKMNSEKEWLALEKDYKTFIIDYAKLAQSLQIEFFCIGTELELFVENRPKFWKELIKAIRSVYTGKLTYAANWDEYKKVVFWSELDFIGIDAYFPLSNAKTPTIKELEQKWMPHKKEIEKVQQQYAKEVLFTEFGYRSVDFATKQPWDSSKIDGQVNLQVQQNGLQAIYNVFWKENWFAGGFLWKWFHNHEKAGGLDNNRFTPQNKPTQQLIKQLYEN